MHFSPLPSADISGESSACLVLLAAIFSPWPSAAWASGEPCCHPFLEQDFAAGDSLEGDAVESLPKEQAREACFCFASNKKCCLSSQPLNFKTASRMGGFCHLHSIGRLLHFHPFLGFIQDYLQGMVLKKAKWWVQYHDAS